MNKFTEMIKAGIAPVRYRAWGKSLPQPDKFANYYNNMWGAASDTHMEKDGERYIVTGQLIRDPKIWETFVSVRTWRCVDFNDTLVDYLDRNGYRGTYDVLNGDTIWAVYPKIEVKKEE